MPPPRRSCSSTSRVVRVIPFSSGYWAQRDKRAISLAAPGIISLLPSLEAYSVPPRARSALHKHRPSTSTSIVAAAASPYHHNVVIIPCLDYTDCFDDHHTVPSFPRDLAIIPSWSRIGSVRPSPRPRLAAIWTTRMARQRLGIDRMMLISGLSRSESPC